VIVTFIFILAFSIFRDEIGIFGCNEEATAR
jgi:hypothetical protein